VYICFLISTFFSRLFPSSIANIPKPLTYGDDLLRHHQMALLVRLAAFLKIALQVTAQGLGKSSNSTELCPYGTFQVIISTVVTHYPVVIDKFFDQNTVININGGVVININNAPTNIITTVQAMETETVTATE
jgi:hypothetical protein